MSSKDMFCLQTRSKTIALCLFHWFMLVWHWPQHEGHRLDEWEVSTGTTRPVATPSVTRLVHWGRTKLWAGTSNKLNKALHSKPLSDKKSNSLQWLSWGPNKNNGKFCKFANYISESQHSCARLESKTGHGNVKGEMMEGAQTLNSPPPPRRLQSLCR